jgi:hypothetical protein
VHPNEIESRRRPLLETKIFDPGDASTGSGGAELLDASVTRRQEQWWLYLAGQAHGYGATDIYAAYLPLGAPLPATGWLLQRGSDGQPTPIAGRSRSRARDGNGGRHCPSYVKGWDTHKRKWVLSLSVAPTFTCPANQMITVPSDGRSAMLSRLRPDGRHREWSGMINAGGSLRDSHPPKNTSRVGAR